MTTQPAQRKPLRCRLVGHRWRDRNGWPAPDNYLGYGAYSPEYICTRCAKSTRFRLRPGRL